jgi:uncharacterized membrane protein YpjA
VQRIDHEDKYTFVINDLGKLYGYYHYRFELDIKAERKKKLEKLKL